MVFQTSSTTSITCKLLARLECGQNITVTAKLGSDYDEENILNLFSGPNFEGTPIQPTAYI